MEVRISHCPQRVSKGAVKIEDVVQMHDDSPRSRWKMAVVENLIKGKDGLTIVKNNTDNDENEHSPVISKQHIRSSAVKAHLAGTKKFPALPRRMLRIDCITMIILCNYIDSHVQVAYCPVIGCNYVVSCNGCYVNSKLAVNERLSTFSSIN